MATKENEQNEHQNENETNGERKEWSLMELTVLTYQHAPEEMKTLEDYVDSGEEIHYESFEDEYLVKEGAEAWTGSLSDFQGWLSDFFPHAPNNWTEKEYPFFVKASPQILDYARMYCAFPAETRNWFKVEKEEWTESLLEQGIIKPNDPYHRALTEQKDSMYWEWELPRLRDLLKRDFSEYRRSKISEN